MKLEAVDKRNAMLIRVTTISDTDDHRVKVYIHIFSLSVDLIDKKYYSIIMYCRYVFSNTVFWYRFILMAGWMSMTIGWMLIVQSCIQ